MAGMDEVRKRTEEGFRVLREAAERIAFTVEREAKIGRKYLEIRRLKKEMEKVYSEMGAFVYEAILAKKAIEAEDPFLKDRVSLIERMRSEIARLEEEIREMRLGEIGRET